MTRYEYDPKGTAYSNGRRDGAKAERQRIADVVWHWEGTRLDLVNHIRDSTPSPVASDSGTTAATMQRNVNSAFMARKLSDND